MSLWLNPGRATNPAMTLWLTIEDRWRGAEDPASATMT